MSPNHLLTALLVALCALPATATAHAGPRRLPEPAVKLPGQAAASSLRADPHTWIVAARPSPASAAIARTFGAAQLTPQGAYLVSRTRARAFAGSLRAARLLSYAEPNSYSRLHATSRFNTDPLDPLASWRDMVVEPSLVPPPVTATSPKLVLIDAQMDTTHPEFAHSRNIRSTLQARPTLNHGTATMGVAAAPRNGIGFSGVWPDMRAYNYATDNLTCASSARQIARAVKYGSATINMSYGSDQSCFSEYVALQRATARGVVLVAAAGNELADGNPLEFPASLPHVLTIAATDMHFSPAYFSNANAAIDLSAPGEDVLTTVPAAMQRAGDPGQVRLGGVDAPGYSYQSGTSFSAPMVAAAATWVRALHPKYSADQIDQAVRFSARDLGAPGWDPNTGYGLLDVGRALSYKVAATDPNEPNDAIFWVDGRAFGKPSSAIFGPTSKTVSRVATLDQYEDPEDVYRVVVPARSRVRVRLAPRYGDADLAAFSRQARTTTCPSRGRCPYLLGRSQNSGTNPDAVIVANTGRSGRTVYVDTYIDQSVNSLNSRYDLRISRLPVSG